MLGKSRSFTQFKKAMLTLALAAFVFEPLLLAMPAEAAWPDIPILNIGERIAGVSFKASSKATIAEVYAMGGSAVGPNATVGSGGMYGVALGYGAQVTGESKAAVAIGYDARIAMGNDAITIGAESRASAQGAIATGAYAKAEGSYAISMGYHANASAEYAIAIGNNANASAEEAIAIGDNAQASAKDAIATGRKAVASAFSAIATGVYAEATAGKAIATGEYAKATNYGAIATGFGACASGAQSIATGLSAQATGANSIATGLSAQATGANSIATGFSAQATGINSIATGNNAQAIGKYAIATGYNANAASEGTIATGANAQATGSDSIATGSNALSTGNSAIATGEGAQATAQNAIATGLNAQAAGSSSTAIGELARAAGNSAIATGSAAISEGENAIAIGSSTCAAANSSIATGYKACATGDSAIATGANALATAYAAIASGRNAIANQSYAIAIGNQACAVGVSSFAAGMLATASGEDSIALGSNTSATAARSIALGYDAKATHSDSVAIGSYSVSGNASEVSVGNSTLKRKITNVAPGEISEFSTDAVNGSQLDDTNLQIKYLNQDVGDLQIDFIDMSKNVNILNQSVKNISNNKADTTIALGGVTINNTGVLNQTTISGTTTNVVQLVDSRIGDMYVTKQGGNTYLNFGVMNNYTGIQYDSQQIDVTQLINANVNIQGSLGNISTSNGIISTKKEYYVGGEKRVDIDIKLAENFNLTNKITNNYASYTSNGIFVSNQGNTINSTLNNTLITFKNGDNNASFSTGGLTFNGYTYVSPAGLNANYKKITLVAPGVISATSMDAVNGSQLYEVKNQVDINTININANTERLNDTYTKAQTRAMVSIGDVLGVTYNDNSCDVIKLSGKDGTKITNVKEGDISATSTDVVTGSQLYQTNTQLAATNMQLAATSKEVQEVGAMSAALAGLHYIEPSGEGDDRLVGAVAYGGYRGQNATAIGLGYKPHQNIMFTASTSIGTSQQSYNAGMSFKFGKGKTLNKAELQKQIVFVNEENKKLKQIVATQGEQIKQLLQIVGEMRGKPVELKANGSADANVPVALLPRKQGEYEVEFGKDYDKAVITLKVEHACKNGVATAYCREEKDDEGKTVYLARVPAANSDEAEQISKKLKELGYEPETVRVQ